MKNLIESDIKDQINEVKKKAEENDYYFRKNNELSSLNTSLRSQRDELQNRINKAIEYIEHLDNVFIDNKEQDNIVNILKGE